jgi:hypothetical protein
MLFSSGLKRARRSRRSVDTRWRGELAGGGLGRAAEVLEDRTLLSISIVWHNRGVTSAEPYIVPPYNNLDLEPDDADTPDNFDFVFGTQNNRSENARKVVDAALAAWERVITDFNDSNNKDNVFTVTIVMDTENLSCGAHARTPGPGHPWNGIPDEGTIVLNTCLGETSLDWFVDETPHESSEFLGPIANAFAGRAPADSPAFDKWDLYSVVAHEMMHILGISWDVDFLWEDLVDENDPKLQPTTKTDAAYNEPDSRLWTYNGGVKALFTTINSGKDSGFPIHTAQPQMNNWVTIGNTTFFGVRDVANAGLPNGWRTLPSLLVSRVFSEVYGYSIRPHMQFPNFYTHLSADGALSVRGGSIGEGPIYTNTADSDDEIMLSLQDGDLLVGAGIGTPVPGTGLPGSISPFQRKIPLANVESIELFGYGGISTPADGDDLFTLNFNLGNWLGTKPLSINGGTGYNKLVVHGLPQATDYVIEAGTIQFDGGSLISFTNIAELELIADPNSSNNTITVLDTGALQKLKIVGGDGVDVIDVQDTNFSLQNLVIHGMAGNDVITVTSMGFNTQLQVNGGTGNDLVILGHGLGRLGFLPHAQFHTIHGGPAGNNQLILQDHDTTSDSDYDFQTASPFAPGIVIRNGFQFLQHSNVHNVILNAGSGNDRFFVAGRPQNSQLTIFGNAGDDEFFLGTGGAGSVVRDIFSKVVVYGGTGANTALVDDSGEKKGKQATVTDTTVGAGKKDSLFGFGYPFGPFSGLEYYELSDLTIELGGGNDTVFVESTAAGTDTTIFGNRGNDKFTVTAPPPPQGPGQGNADRRREGTVDGIKSLLTIDGGWDRRGGGNDQLLVIDTTDTAPNTMTLTEATIGMGTGDDFLGSASAGIVYKAISKLDILMGSGGNRVFVESTHPETKTAVKTGKGDDEMLIRNTAGTVNDIRSQLDIDGQDGYDVVVVDDAAETAAGTVTVTALAVLGDGTFFGPGGQLTYTGWAELTVKTGAGDDTAFVHSTASAVHTTLHTGAGFDLVTVSQNDLVNAIHGPLTVDGGSPGGAAVALINSADLVPNEVVLTDTQVLGNGSFFGFGGSFAYANIKQLNLVSGTAGDVINVQATHPETSYLIGGGAGNNLIRLDSNGAAAGGHVQAIVSHLSFIGGGTDLIVIDNTDDPTGNTVTLAPTGPFSGTVGAGPDDDLFGPGGRLTYQNVEGLLLRTSDAGQDVIHVAPALGTAFIIDAQSPGFAVLPADEPGDRLVLDLQGVADPRITMTGFGNGMLTSATHASLGFRNIELVAEASGGAKFDLVLDMNAVELPGNDGNEDRIEVFSSRFGPDKTLRLEIDGQPVFVGVDAAVNSLTVFGSADSDTLLVFETPEGLPALPGSSPFGHTNVPFQNSGALPQNVGLHFDGGTGAGVDQYVLTLITPQNVGVFPDPPPQLNPNSGVVNVEGAFTLSYDHLTPIVIAAAGGALLIDAALMTDTTELTLVDLGGDVWRIDGDGGFEATTFSGFDDFFVNLPDGVPLRMGGVHGTDYTLVSLRGVLSIFSDEPDDGISIETDDRGAHVTYRGLTISFVGVHSVEFDPGRSGGEDPHEPRREEPDDTEDIAGRDESEFDEDWSLELDAAFADFVKGTLDLAPLRPRTGLLQAERRSGSRNG